jgi:glycosyltransferase involved in cell wall biosynthesis
VRIVHVDASVDERGGQRQLLLLAARWPEPALVVVRQGAPSLGPLREAGLAVETAPFWRGTLGTRALQRLVRKFGAGALAAHDRHASVHAHRLGLPWVAHRRVDFAPSAWGARRYRQARGVIAVSEAVARVMRGVGVERLAVVHDGVEVPVAPPDREGVRRELGLPPEAPLVLAAGAHVEHKAQHVLVSAMVHLPQVHLALAGAGPLEGRLRAQASALGVARRVHLLGWRRDLPRWLASADAFAHSSVEEGLGQVVLEAALAGLPLVISQAGGLRELGLGLPFAPGDALGLARALERVLRGACAPLPPREGLLARFGADRMVQETLAAYQHFGLP